MDITPNGGQQKIVAKIPKISVFDTLLFLSAIIILQPLLTQV